MNRRSRVHCNGFPESTSQVTMNPAKARLASRRALRTDRRDTIFTQLSKKRSRASNLHREGTAKVKSPLRLPSLSGTWSLGLWARTCGAVRESMRLAVFGAGDMG